MGKILQESDSLDLKGATLVTNGHEAAHETALLLQAYGAKMTGEEMPIASGNAAKSPIIRLQLAEDFGPAGYQLASSANELVISASTARGLYQGGVALLEHWGVVKSGDGGDFIPLRNGLPFPKNQVKNSQSPFSFRAILYPGAYDVSFRRWYGLDWHETDFGLWGHSMDQLVSAKRYWPAHTEYFAWYEGKRRPEALCLTHPKVFEIARQSLQGFLLAHPQAKYFSISQMDDVIYCQCDRCSEVNRQNGGPQGALYYFVNQLAALHPEVDFATLAYLYTANPPTQIRPEQNVVTILCPISLDRGAPIQSGKRNQYFLQQLRAWLKVQPRLMVWDYTVQFTHYISPFPNFHTFQENMWLYRDAGLEGVFMQGYADVPGSFYALRQYLLSKLMADPDQALSLLTRQFLMAHYGNAAEAIEEYLKILTNSQEQSGSRLDIYGGPVQAIKTFLSPAIIDRLDKQLQKAEGLVKGDSILESRVAEVRMELEYAVFEQGKYFGKEKHGMFVFGPDDHWEVKANLAQRVEQMVQIATQKGIYELSEGGMSPAEYGEDWLAFSQYNPVFHKGEHFKYNFVHSPSTEYDMKGVYGLQDGIRGWKDFSYNWTGWYGTDAVIEVQGNEKIKKIRLNFLEDQRHWIFLPQGIKILAKQGENWKIIATHSGLETFENYEVTLHDITLDLANYKKGVPLRVEVQNLENVPAWRYREGRKPLMMIDEIELY